VIRDVGNHHPVAMKVAPEIFLIRDNGFASTSPTS
jgi:hypothetical protein